MIVIPPRSNTFSDWMKNVSLAVPKRTNSLGKQQLELPIRT